MRSAAIDALGKVAGVVEAAPGVPPPATKEPPEQLKAAVAALAQLLKDPDPATWGEPIDALGRIGPAASDTVPALAEVFKSKRPDLHRRAAMALARIQPAARSPSPS